MTNNDYATLRSRYAYYVSVDLHAVKLFVLKVLYFVYDMMPDKQIN